MKGLFPALRARSASSIVVILTLAALCFSVGEGLRLRPFPVPQAEPTNGFTIDRSSRILHFNSGPLDVPTQLQKRNKRLAVDLLGPVSRYNYKPFTRLYRSFEQRSTAVASTILFAFPSDRGPPFTS